MAQRSRRLVRPIGLGHGWEPLEDRRVPASLGLGVSLPDVFAPPAQGLDTISLIPPVIDPITVSASLTTPVTDPATVSVSVPLPTASTDPVSVEIPAPSVSVGPTASEGDSNSDPDSTTPITLPLPSVEIDPTSSAPVVSVPITDIPIVGSILDPITSTLDGDSPSGGDSTSPSGGDTTSNSGGSAPTAGDGGTGATPGDDSTTDSPISINLPSIGVNLPPIVVDLPPIIVDLPPIVVDLPPIVVDLPTVTVDPPTVTIDPPPANDPPDPSGDGDSPETPPTSTPSTGTTTPPPTTSDPTTPPTSSIPSTGDGSTPIIRVPPVVIEIPTVPVPSKVVPVTETPTRSTAKPVVEVVKPDSVTVEETTDEIPINTDARSMVVPTSASVGFSGMANALSGSMPLPSIEIARAATSNAAFVAPVATSSLNVAPMLLDWMPSPAGVDTLRTGVRLALAEIGTPILATPLEPFVFDFDSTFSMLQAALTTTPTATADVSGLIVEMGDFVASLQGDSVGRLVQMAAFSPWTWVTLGVVVVVTAELMRRELRNTSEAPVLDSDPDLLAPWGIP